jgi:autotransporter-associated beta strand protein
MNNKLNGVSLRTLACGLLAGAVTVHPASAQQTIVVAAGTTDTGQKVVGGTDSLTVEANGVLSTTTNPAVNWSTSSTDLRITNAGTISSTANDGRAINAGGGNNPRTVSLLNQAGGVIESQNDAFRINVAPTSGLIRVDNYGTIRTTVSGQALDFDAITGGAAVFINNYQGAELRGFGQDAIRPGQSAVVSNAGLIISDGAPNNSYDGIDWQQKSGVVLNTPTGTISGLRHGITSDIDVNVTNGGTIIGRNGSGIGSDGTGIVVNTGTITGQWDGVATNGDGDGVDIDFAGTIVNGGTIQGLSATGVDSGGRANSAEGVAMGGGSITNNVGATIFGAGTGVLINHDTNAGGVADAATTIVNAGTIRGGDGRAITLVGDFADTITNSGTITGGTVGAIDMGGGDDTLALTTTSVITGVVDGGAGNDTVALGGTGNGSFAGAVNFEALQVNSGAWTLPNPQSYATTTIAANAALIGSSASLGNSIANAGTLQFDQATDGTFTGAITGSGQLVKAGAGTLTLGAQSYTGATRVQTGTLALTGNLAGGTYDVASGATVTSGLAATISTTATDVSITNSGTIANTRSDGRAINFGGSNNARTITIVNNAGATITSADDAVRVNFNPTGGSIRVDNYGTIQTTAGGQALDFNAAASGAAPIVINNYQSGQLLSVGQDAIRPGQGAVVTNAGLIRSDGTPNNSYDGIDWQQSAGTVVNTATGTISGLRHGITSDIDVNVTNGGTIIGRNGSGIGSDGTGRVINTGTITGQWDGVATNGDGDGVDIDFAGTIVNSGTIQGLSATGVDSGGRPNSAEGVAMGGGSITNNAGATIFGAGTGVLINHDTNPGGVADAATTIVNAGTIRGGSGRAITLIGNFADTITNAGTITGGTAGAIDMGGGDDTLALTTTSAITGVVDGGAGSDRVQLGGTGNGSFAGAVNFEQLEVGSGNWTLTAASTYANGTAITTPATLIGNAATLTGSIADAGTLVFNQASDGTAAIALSGTGLLTKTGAGTLTIGNQSGFTGRVGVDAGRLVLAGALPGAVTVNTGATLAGVGTVASLTVASGGTVAPGTGIGTISVAGGFVQASGSTYLADTTSAGLSDRIAVGGTASIANGAVLRVSRDTGTYTVGTRYTFLTANGGVSGTYTLQQTAAGATELRLVQLPNAVAVDVARTAASLSGVATTRNQAAVAAPFGSLGVANAAYAALTLVPSDAAVRAGLDDLSGEIHATVRTTMLRSAQGGEDAVRARLLEPGTARGVWGQMTGQTGEDDGDAAAAPARRRGWGAFGGVDVALGDAGRAGVAGGYTHTNLTLKRGLGSADVESWQVLGYTGINAGPVALRGSIGYAWGKNEVERQVGFSGFSATATSDYDGSVLHGFAEAGIPVPALGGTVEPFGGVEVYRVQTDSFAESSSAVALNGRDRKETFVLGTLGLRGQTPITEGLSARSRIGWQRSLDDRRPGSVLQFAAGGSEFAVTGTPLSRDAALLALDLAWQPTERVSITAGYSGLLGDAGSDNRGLVMLSVSF